MAGNSAGQSMPKQSDRPRNGNTMPRWLTFSSAWTPGNLVGLVGPWRISGSKKLRDVPVLSDATVFAVRIHSGRVLVFLGLCPWCQSRTARYRAHRIEPIVSAFASPKLWTFTGGPNQEELTGAGISAVQGAVVSMHKRVYIKKRCRGGFRKIEITKKDNDWNVHCHELADAEYVPQWPQTDIAWPAKPFTPYTMLDKYAKPVKHPGLAVLFTEACQKYPELKADGVRWKGWPVFAKDNPASWFIVDVRVANYSPENEISKYISKGNEIVMAGGRSWITCKRSRASSYSKDSGIVTT